MMEERNDGDLQQTEVRAFGGSLVGKVWRVEGVKGGSVMVSAGGITRGHCTTLQNP
jgi:hypothetical protein